MRIIRRRFWLIPPSESSSLWGASHELEPLISLQYSIASFVFMSG